MSGEQGDVSDRGPGWWGKFFAVSFAAFVIMRVGVDAYEDVPSDWERCYAQTMALIAERYGNAQTDKQKWLGFQLRAAQSCGGGMGG